jgi:6-phosphogluconolactonase
MRTSRQALGAVGITLSAILAFGGTPVRAKTFVYVSAAQVGAIDAYEMDAGSGALTSIGKFEAGKLVMPMTVSPDKKFLYAVVRSQPYRVLSYAIDPGAGVLTQKATAPLPDSMPFVSTDRSGRFLFTASYGGDKVAVSPISESGIVEADAIQIVPTGRNAHAILADRTNRFVFATNLGANQILQFQFDARTGKLTPNDPPSIMARPGHGPRHFVISADNKRLYVLNELSGHVDLFSIDPAKGTLTEIDSVASVPADSGLVPGVPQAPVGQSQPGTPGAAAPAGDEKAKIWAADLQLSPDGKFLYSTERTTSKIALFTVASGNGKLSYVTNYATEKQPRGIRIDPAGRYLVASGEKSDHLAVYKIDPSNGTLTQAGRFSVGNGANWIEIVDLP